jgi:hypothetical protein
VGIFLAEDNCKIFWVDFAIAGVMEGRGFSLHLSPQRRQHGLNYTGLFRAITMMRGGHPVAMRSVVASCTPWIIKPASINHRPVKYLIMSCNVSVFRPGHIEKTSPYWSHVLK